MQERLGPPTSQRGTADVNANGKVYNYGQSLHYAKDGWSLGCIFVNGVCVKITYNKNAAFTDDDLRTILKNEAQGAQWTQSVSYTTLVDSVILPTMKVREWKRADGAQAQIIGNSLVVVTPEFQKAVDGANAKAKADAEKKMPDL